MKWRERMKRPVPSVVTSTNSGESQALKDLVVSPEPPKAGNSALRARQQKQTMVRSSACVVVIVVSLFLIFVYLGKSRAAQADLILQIFLSLPPRYQECRHVPLCQATLAYSFSPFLFETCFYIQYISVRTVPNSSQFFSIQIHTLSTSPQRISKHIRNKK